MGSGPGGRSANTVVVLCFVTFFSSRRRHTRWNCDWSSDVCSSDLVIKLRIPTGFDEKLLGLSSSVPRSEEHTSELQSQFHLVCRLLLEKKTECIINFFSFFKLLKIMSKFCQGQAW